MSNKDTVGPPVRRPSWTGALGAKLGRILNGVDDEEREEVYVDLVKGGERASLASSIPYGKVVVGKEGGE